MRPAWGTGNRTFDAGSLRRLLLLFYGHTLHTFNGQQQGMLCAQSEKHAPRLVVIFT